MLLHLLVALSLASDAPVGSKLMLQRVDAEVDGRVTYQADPAGQDVWREAQWSGDCEDYALAKRKLLLSLGWPAANLKIVFVDTPVGGHAMLWVPSLNVVLDNGDEDSIPAGKVWDLTTWLDRADSSFICAARDISLGTKNAGARC